MFKRHDVLLLSNTQCVKAVENISPSDFFYYDKDGFELNIAEQKFYSAMNFPLHHRILNHTCWQEPWFELERNDTSLILDHCMFLCRSNYSGQALEQLTELKLTIPTADYLLRTRAKWGFDFALDAVSDDGDVFEVLHVEFDSPDIEYFKNRMIMMDYTIRHTDWEDAAQRVWDNRSQWQHLRGFKQNDWKAQYLLGWNNSEYTEKTV